ncbi:MAG: hypothetical protein ORN50_04425, partial [Crocinitomicaceae bacterium]|nr:hypothetical protein [Crocinitomicaceae bacterium]
MKLLKSSVPLWLVLLIVAGVGTMSLISICAFLEKNTLQNSANNSTNNCGIIRYRSSRHGEFTRPLLMADSPKESDELLDLKSKFIETINNNT